MPAVALQVIPDIVRGPAVSSGCASCPLSHNGKPSKPVPGEGPVDPLFIVIGEGPGKTEMLMGRPFVGPSGRLLERALKANDVPRERLWVTNASLCLPPPGKNDALLKEARECCAPRLKQELAMFPQRPVLTLGGVGAQALLGDSVKITQVASSLHDIDVDETGPRPVIPTHHPARILRGGDGKSTSSRAVDTLFLNIIYDIGKVKALGEGQDIRFKDNVEIEVESPFKALALVRRIAAEIRSVGWAAADVETDDINARTCQLTAIAVATINWGASIAYPLFSNKTAEGREAWKILRGLFHDHRLRWVFQNRIFDELVLERHGITILGRVDDIMLKHHVAFPGAAHDLQAEATQFLAVRPWKAEFRAGRDEKGRPDTTENLLKYNVVDALTTARLNPPLDACVDATKTRGVYEIDNALTVVARRMEVVGIPIYYPRNRELHKGFTEIIVRTRAEIEGPTRDETFRKKFLDRLAVIQARTKRKGDPDDFLTRHEMRFQEALHGRRKKRNQNECLKGHGPVQFSISNDTHIAAYLQAKGYRLGAVTPTGKPSTAKDVLDVLTHIPEVRTILEYREARKLDSTFVDRLPLEGKGNFRRLHSTWDVHKITGRWGSKPNCFSGDTELLTNQGWIRFDALEPNLREHDTLLVAQFDNDRDRIEFKRPTRYIENHFDGQLVAFDNKHIDFLGTPDHRLLLERRSGQREVVHARELVEDRRILHAPATPFAGTVSVDPYMIRLICAVQADGSWRISSWIFGFTKQRKIDRITETLNGLGLSFSQRTRTLPNPFKPGTTRQRDTFYVHANPVCRDILDLLGPKKRFGPWLLQWDAAALDLFLEEILFWDGCWARRNNYSSSTPGNADWVQIVALLRGHRANVRVFNGSKIQKKPNYQIDLTMARRTSLTTGLELKTVAYAGKVYCVSVPSSFIVVRRNGKAFITGQCQNWSKQNQKGRPNLRSQVVAPHKKLLVGADYAQIEARMNAWLSGDPFLMSIFVGNYGNCPLGCDPLTEPHKFCPKHDIHTVFAMEVFHGFLAMDTDTKKELRDIIKRGEYGAFYGGAVDTLYQSIVKLYPDVTLPEVARIVQILTSKMPRFLAWHNELVRQAMREGEIRSAILGRRRTFPLGNADLNVIYNFPAQATTADVIDIGILAMRTRLKRELPGVWAELIVQGHDSVVLEVDEDCADQVATIVTETLTQEFTYNDQKMLFPANATVAENWKRLDFGVDKNVFARVQADLYKVTRNPHEVAQVVRQLYEWRIDPDSVTDRYVEDAWHGSMEIDPTLPKHGAWAEIGPRLIEGARVHA